MSEARTNAQLDLNPVPQGNPESRSPPSRSSGRISGQAPVHQSVIECALRGFFSCRRNAFAARRSEVTLRIAA